MFQTSIGVLKPFHALKELLASSSWFDQVPNFRQEIRQSNYRNDPVKYDLNLLLVNGDLNFLLKRYAFEKKPIVNKSFVCLTQNPL